MSESENSPKLVSFNVDSGKTWESFKKLASEDGRSASWGLNELIRQALERDSIAPIDTNGEAVADIDLSDYIKKSEFETAIAGLGQQLEKMSEEVEAVKKLG